MSGTSSARTPKEVAKAWLQELKKKAGAEGKVVVLCEHIPELDSDDEDEPRRKSKKIKLEGQTIEMLNAAKRMLISKIVQYYSDVAQTALSTIGAIDNGGGSSSGSTGTTDPEDIEYKSGMLAALKDFPADTQALVRRVHGWDGNPRAEGGAASTRTKQSWETPSSETVEMVAEFTELTEELMAKKKYAEVFGVFLGTFTALTRRDCWYVDTSEGDACEQCCRMLEDLRTLYDNLLERSDAELGIDAASRPALAYLTARFNAQLKHDMRGKPWPRDFRLHF